MPTKQTRRFTGVIDTKEAARRLGLAESTLVGMRSRPGGPTYVKLGSRVVYRPEDIDAWIDANLYVKTGVKAP